METLPTELIVEIGLRLDRKNIIAFFSVNKNYFAIRNDKFWLQKLRRDFGAKAEIYENDNESSYLRLVAQRLWLTVVMGTRGKVNPYLLRAGVNFLKSYNDIRYAIWLSKETDYPRIYYCVYDRKTLLDIRAFYQQGRIMYDLTVTKFKLPKLEHNTLVVFYDPYEHKPMLYMIAYLPRKKENFEAKFYTNFIEAHWHYLSCSTLKKSRLEKVIDSEYDLGL